MKQGISPDYFLFWEHEALFELDGLNREQKKKREAHHEAEERRSFIAWPEQTT